MTGISGSYATWIQQTKNRTSGHEQIFETFGVSHERCDDCVMCRFTEDQARAFVLLHVFMHELGHHYDHIHQKHLGASKGENYAESFANRHFEQLFPAYVKIFGHPAGRS